MSRCPYPGSEKKKAWPDFSFKKYVVKQIRKKYTLSVTYPRDRGVLALSFNSSLKENAFVLHARQETAYEGSFFFPLLFLIAPKNI